MHSQIVRFAGGDRGRGVGHGRGGYCFAAQ